MANAEKSITDIRDILTLLGEVNKTLEAKIYIPSSKKEIVVKPLNANHIKNMLKTTIEGPFSDNQFNIIIFNILKEIIDVPLHTLTILDKIAILIQLRQINISNKIVIEKSDEDTKKTIINISDYISNLKKQDFDISDKEVGDDNIKVTVSMPSIEDEYRFELDLHTRIISKIGTVDAKSLKTLFAPLFINNMTQYIKSISIGDNIISVNNKKVEERLAITESLPSVITTSIINAIDKNYGKQLINIATYEGEILPTNSILFVSED